MNPFNALSPRRWFIGALIALALDVGALHATAEAEPSLQQVFDAFFSPAPTVVLTDGGTPDPNLDTLRTTFPPGRYQVTVIARCALARASIGWYATSNPAVLTTIFSDEGGAGSSCLPLSPSPTVVIVDIPEEFGLWLEVPQVEGSPNLFLSDAAFNNDEVDHFVVYTVPLPRGGFAIGIEDTLNGGDQDFQDAALFLVALNQPPFFDTIADQFVNPALNVDQTVSITGVVPGPPSEVVAGQTVALSATSDNPTLIPHPTISGPTEGNPAWTLKYHRATNLTGQATITVKAQDNGGTASGGTNTFTRVFEITVGAGAAGAVNASVTNLNLAGGPLVTVVVTAGPIDFTGDGVPDCYRFFPPRPAPSEPFNVIPSNADETPEAPLWSIPGDTVEICNTTRTFPAVLDLRKWITKPGTHQTDISYISVVRDPACPGPSCIDRIWTGEKPAGSVTFTTGDSVAVKNTVTLKTLDLVTKKSTSTRLSDIPARDFDIKNHDFLVAAGAAVRSTLGSPDPSINFPLLSTILGKIFEADKGRIGTCVTDATGVCFAGQAAPAFDLIIVKFFDLDTGRTIYVADVKRPAEFVHGIAVENIVITKLFKNGVFQGYAPGFLMHVD